jgi:hypothetical protein
MQAQGNIMQAKTQAQSKTEWDASTMQNQIQSDLDQHSKELICMGEILI